MTVDRIVHLVAGLMVLAGIALSYAVHPYWLGLSVFVGLNLAQSGLTNFCPLAFMLKKAGVREGAPYFLAASSCSWVGWITCPSRPASFSEPP